MKITLPKIERIVFNQPGNKNHIKQLIAPESCIQSNVVHIADDYLIIEEGQRLFCFTQTEENLPVDYDYVLLTNHLPTVDLFERGGIAIKKWLKHPMLEDNHSIDSIIDSWKDRFSYKEENLEKGIKGLRKPQIAALHMIMGHLLLPLDTATIVLPTGTGKTETMLSTMIAGRCTKLLVTVPSDSLRIQIAHKFQSLGLLKQFGVVQEDALYPIVGVIRQGFKSFAELKEFFESCNVIVTTMSILTGCSEEFQREIASACSHVFIDEAHHIKAASWNEFKGQFPAKKVLQFTATPFRNDGQRLDGKIIFNFPLKHAQEQGYFKKIEFISVREYDFEKADKEIARVALARLKRDIAGGANHILMARCGTKERARQVFELYRHEAEYNPVLLYSGVPEFRKAYESVINKTAKIIVCVDMLGEGFDLPELKIAAFHDIRKSLPVTLQFAGRFTRTKHDETLGSASFIANIADLNVRTELADLYAFDADWNQILSNSSYGKIKNEEEFSDLMAGFKNLASSIIPFQNIKTNISTVAFKNKSNTWFPLNFESGIPGYDKLEYKFSDVNRDENILIIITGRKEEVEWINTKDIYLINWNVTLVYWETKMNLLFINSSDNSSLYKDLARAVIGESAELIRGIDVFKVFHDVKRTKLQNVGLRYFLGKNERFRMSVGSDVAEALGIAERQKGEKAFVMGVGYEEGLPVNLGASYKGRIWAKLKGDILLFKSWCQHIGSKLIDPNIDPNQVLRETLIPTQVAAVPNRFPVWIDWDVDMYLGTENRFKFLINGFPSDMSSSAITLEDPKTGGPIFFSVSTEAKKIIFQLALFENDTDPENRYPDFKVTQLGTDNAVVEYGNKKVDGADFFEEFVPTIWFADGSALTGNDFVELKQEIGQFPREQIMAWTWDGVDLRKEAQGINPKLTDSIQYKVIEQLMKTDVDIIYDDDYSGEIADVVTLKLHDDRIKVDLYHLKYANDGVVSAQIKNFYEVCGQAQKSVHWRHRDGADFINHLLRRKVKKRDGQECSRLERGTERDLERLLAIVKKEIPVEFDIYIVQPGASKKTVTSEILTLLGVTENFIKEIGGVNLKVITSI